MVLSHMIHGPCGALNRNSPCMVDRQCTKRFPKQFLECTEQGNDSYPKYRRRKPEDGGSTGKIMMRQDGKQVEQEVTNQWVVPYNPFLLRQFNCHINVEICSSINSIKYVLKYITKGTDQAVFQLQNTEQADNQQQTTQSKAVDEIAQFQNARYVGSSEAAWRILEHPTHEHFPPVVGLAVHLENGQRVMFTEANALKRAQSAPPATTLTAFFDLCTTDNFAKTLKYPELPEYYTWNKGIKQWQRRKRGRLVDGEDQGDDIRKVHAIGRIYTVSPRAGECYYLRLLLNEVSGPTSFQYLKIVNNDICHTYREACLVRGLLENDQHLSLAMEEATVTQSPANLRSLLAIILTTCMPTNPVELWILFKDQLSEDFLHQHRRNINNQEANYNNDIYNQVREHDFFSDLA